MADGAEGRGNEEAAPDGILAIAGGDGAVVRDGAAAGADAAAGAGGAWAGAGDAGKAWDAAGDAAWGTGEAEEG